MARQVIGIGTIPGDGTGDTLRDSFDKVNDNFNELYGVQGWGNYADNGAVSIVLNNIDQKITINGLGSSNNTSYLPYEIRGTGQLWNASTNKITPIGLGDTYTCRLTLGVISKTASPSEFFLTVDIGGGATPTNIIYSVGASVLRTPPFDASLTFDIFCLGTFLANGGQIFCKVDSGTLTVTPRSLFITRISKGQL